ncbi:hypothetical protein GNI_059030 [Gregarina niphandrodes]|uniref:Uncharacterized protein n=1 Tax=Gregarina niphandrodes TaxID=110365 RepID=A0A023B8L6_GRENI|nr:hypothetical protein GNI_059030 [Gregarina niphandrodes]EZG69242.1 hypothetical protein GNI_059030 [Gregarina niphandrodes]|eukprot:XP_011134457.1 hypothetical protein GNI_059030 [Gregarina niphandrodes]
MRTMVFDVADGWLPNPLWRTLKAVYACQAAGVLLNGMYGAYVFAAHQLGPLQTAQDVEHKLRHVFGLHTTAPDLSLAPPRPPPRPKPRGRRRRKPTNWR